MAFIFCVIDGTNIQRYCEVDVCKHPRCPLVRNAPPGGCGDVPRNAGNGEEVGNIHSVFDSNPGFAGGFAAWYG